MFTQKTQDSFLDINQLVLPNITGESFFPTLISFIMCVAMSFVIKFIPDHKDLAQRLIRSLHMTPRRHSKYLIGLAMLGYVVYI